MKEDSVHHRQRDTGGVQVPAKARRQMVYPCSNSEKELF